MGDPCETGISSGLGERNKRARGSGVFESELRSFHHRENGVSRNNKYYSVCTDSSVVKIRRGQSSCRANGRYTLTPTGRPVKTTERVAFSPATRTSIVRRAGGSMREPGARRSVRRREASFHFISTHPAHFVFPTPEFYRNWLSEPFVLVPRRRRLCRRTTP